MKIYSGISSILGIGDSQTTWLGRSLYHNKLFLKVLGESRGSILILGSGALEPIEISKLDMTNSPLIALDFNNNVEKYYYGIVEGSIIGSDIEKIFRNKLVGRNSIRADYKTRLDIIRMDNIKNITLVKQDVEYFFYKNTLQHKAIIAHNLVNNLRFQENYNGNKKLLDFYKNCENTISSHGLISLVDNYEWFQNKYNKQFSTLALIINSGLEVLCHYPAYVSIINNKRYHCINENNNLILQKKGHKQYLCVHVKKIKKYFLGKLIEYDIQNFNLSIGSFSNFRKSLNKNNTNLILLKIGEKKYLWLNINGSYNKVFSILGVKGFYPKELWHFLK